MSSECLLLMAEQGVCLAPRCWCPGCGLEADWGDCTIDENGEARCPECGYMMEDVRDAGDS